MDTSLPAAGDATRPVRILWQSSTVIERYPAYRAALLAHARERLWPSSSLDARGVARATAPPHYRAFDFLNNRGILDSALRAQDEGYDAVAIGCFLDPVLDELKELLDIPVLGLAETGLHMACTLGRRFGVLSHSAALNTKFHDDLIHKYGLARHAVPLVSFDLSLAELEAALAGDAGSCLERIARAGREAVAQGAEVIVLGCGLMNLVAIRNGLTEIDGACIVDITGLLVKTTEARVVLRRTSGLGVSHKGYYARPDSAAIAQAWCDHGMAPPRCGDGSNGKS